MGTGFLQIYRQEGNLQNSLSGRRGNIPHWQTRRRFHPLYSIPSILRNSQKQHAVVPGNFRRHRLAYSPSLSKLTVLLLHQMALVRYQIVSPHS
jgi:hypothetical protein